MGEDDAVAGRQPLLFVVHGAGQPLNTRADRSKIARHLSKQYHRQKRKPLYEKTRQSPPQVVHYPVSYHHGGQRLAVASDTPPAKKRKLVIKKEDTDHSAPSYIPLEENGPAKKIEDRKVSNANYDCQHVVVHQAPGEPCKSAVTPLERPQSPPRHRVLIDKSIQQSARPLMRTPFQHLPIPSDGCVSLTIDYFRHRWAPDFDRDYKLSGYHEPHLTIVFPLAMDQAVLLQSLVAMCRVFWLIARDQTWQDESEYLKHRGRALALVQAKLERESVADDATLLAIVCLTSIELLASNATAVVAHARGLKLLVDKRHGEGNDSTTSRYAKASAKAHAMLGRYIKRRVTSTAPSQCLWPSQHSPPPSQLDKPLIYPSHPYEPDMCQSLSCLPDGFCELAFTRCLSLECIGIITSLSRKAEEWSVVRMGADVDSELQALYRLHDLPGKTPPEDFLVYGLLCFCNQFPNKFENRNPFFNIALKCFDDAGKAQQKITRIGYQPWLTWVSVVMAGALEICASPLEGRHVVLDSLLDGCDDARDWDWLERSMRRFLWTDKLGGHWRRCWEEGMLRWDERERSRRSSSSCGSASSRHSGASDGLGYLNAGLAKVLRDSYELNEAYMQAGVR